MACRLQTTWGSRAPDEVVPCPTLRPIRSSRGPCVPSLLPGARERLPPRRRNPSRACSRPLRNAPRPARRGARKPQPQLRARRTATAQFNKARRDPDRAAGQEWPTFRNRRARRAAGRGDHDQYRQAILAPAVEFAAAVEAVTAEAECEAPKTADTDSAAATEQSADAGNPDISVEAEGNITDVTPALVVAVGGARPCSGQRSGGRAVCRSRDGRRGQPSG